MTECTCHSYASLMHAYVVALEKERDMLWEFRNKFKRERDEAREELARLQGWEGPPPPGPGESYDELHREY